MLNGYILVPKLFEITHRLIQGVAGVIAKVWIDSGAFGIFIEHAREDFIKTRFINVQFFEDKVHDIRVRLQNGFQNMTRLYSKLTIDSGNLCGSLNSLLRLNGIVVKVHKRL